MWELLAPAGSYESIIAAVNAGADAVYAGGSLFGARAYADNPDEKHLIQGINYCHLHGCRLYLTVNTLLREKELEEMLEPFLRPLYESGVDGVIVQDLGVASWIHERFPGLPLHASTQMTVTGADGVRFLQAEGFSRVVPARELSLAELREIMKETDIEIETFIHGAMCYSYSGQCLFSSLIGGRSGNRGRCAQPCRLPVCSLDGGKSSENAGYLLSMKDMCTLDLLPDILEAGIASLKIEGRMKRPEYTAGVVSIYRKYIDLYQAAGRAGYRVEEDDRTVLLDLYNRGGFSEGYYREHNGRNMMSLHRPNHRGTPALRVCRERRSPGNKPSSVRAQALVSLGKGDVIELPGGREITLAADTKQGLLADIPGGRPQPAEGTILYRTRNVRLLEELRKKYVAGDRKREISGIFTVSPDSPAMLRLMCGDVEAAVCSAVLAEPAVSRPADAEEVRRQLQKTGNTPFVFRSLEVQLTGRLFIPVAKLNELRREGLEKLEQALLDQSRRSCPENLQQEAATLLQSGGTSSGTSLPENLPRETAVLLQSVGTFSGTFPPENLPWETAVQTQTAAPYNPRVNVLVTTKEQLEAVLENDFAEIDTIYLDTLLLGAVQRNVRKNLPGKAPAGANRQDLRRELFARIKQRGWRCFLNCPPVLRSLDRALLEDASVQELLCSMDGFLVHTIDELSYFRELIRRKHLPAVIVADENLYVCNRRAAAFLYGHGVSRITLPAELNFRELMDLGLKNTELVVYGYQPLMQSAQCVRKNTSGCTGIPSVMYLNDRRNVRFPVLNRCPVCCNTIYNSIPLMLCGCRAELKRLAPAYVRLSFTVESAEETRRMLNRCLDLLGGKVQWERTEHEGTRGHFKRGVE